MLIPQIFLTNEYDKGKTYRGKVVEEYIYIYSQCMKWLNTC